MKDLLDKMRLIYSYYGVTTTFQLQIAQQLGSNQDKMWAISAPKSIAGYELVPLP